MNSTTLAYLKYFGLIALTAGLLLILHVYMKTALPGSASLRAVYDAKLDSSSKHFPGSFWLVVFIPGVVVSTLISVLFRKLNGLHMFVCEIAFITLLALLGRLWVAWIPWPAWYNYAGGRGPDAVVSLIFLAWSMVCWGQLSKENR